MSDAPKAIFMIFVGIGVLSILAAYSSGGSISQAAGSATTIIVAGFFVALVVGFIAMLMNLQG